MPSLVQAAHTYRCASAHSSHAPQPRLGEGQTPLAQRIPSWLPPCPVQAYFCHQALGPAPSDTPAHPFVVGYSHGFAFTGVGLFAQAHRPHVGSYDWAHYLEIQALIQMTIKTHIISLASATHRRDFQSQQAEHLGFHPIFHSAVSTSDISDAFYKEQAFYWRRPLKTAELACFLSHLSLWRIISVSPEPAAILEDDAILGDNWVKDLEELDHLKGVDYICLETWKNKILSMEKKIGHLTLRRLHLNSAGSAGYILWPKGAKLLIDQYEKIGPGLADGFINGIDSWQAWQLVPANVIQMNVAPLYGLESPSQSGSLISKSENFVSSSIHIRLGIRMKVRRLLGELRKAKINLGVLAGKSRIHVPFQENTFRGDR